MASNAFEGLSLVVIIANSFSLVFTDPTSDTPSPLLDSLDNIFTTFYTIEMFLKIFGMGFIGNQGAYLRDMWNILDFTVVCSAYV